MKAIDQRKCPKCGGPVPHSSGPGRPSVYCGVPCRRVAEHELRRLQSLLRRSQQKAQDAAFDLAMVSSYGEARAQKVLTFWESEIVRLEGVLRGILAANPTEGDVPKSA
jgi:hypothetical protein